MSVSSNFSSSAGYIMNSAAMSAGLSYLWNVTEVVVSASPLATGGIYGATAALVVLVTEKLFATMEEHSANPPSDEFKFVIQMAAFIIIGTGVTVALGNPMTYTAGMFLSPAVILAYAITQAAMYKFEEMSS